MWITFATTDNINDISMVELECFEKQAWSKDMIASNFNNHNKYLICQTDDDEIIGYLSFLELDIECELLRLAVRKKFRKQGHAKALMEFFIDYCVEHKKEKIFLEVNSQNFNAIKLYESLNFEPISVRKNYYGENEDAINYIKLL